MPLRYLVAFIFCLSSSSYAQSPPPGLTPEVFAMAIISKKNEFEFGSVFSDDGTEFYYSSNQDIYWVGEAVIDQLRDSQSD